MTNKAWIGVILLLLCVLAALAALAAFRAYLPASGSRQDTTNTPLAPVAHTGPLRLSDDAALKTGQYWLEQQFEVRPDKRSSAEPLMVLYLSADGSASSSSGSGPYILMGYRQVSLIAGGQKPKVCAEAALAGIEPGAHKLGVLARNGELTAWLDDRQVLAWTIDPSAGTLAGNSGVRVLGERVKLTLPLSTLDLSTIRFDDNFMRATADANWHPAAGRWELTAMSFPERSANPFSLRAVFSDESVSDEKLYAGRKRHDNYGLGFEFSVQEGTPSVMRITGGSPAARAGLAENDIFLEIDGQKIQQTHIGMIHQLLMRGGRSDLRLKVLRPGESQPREFTLARDNFRWGTPAEGLPLDPQLPLEQSGGDNAAWIMTGKTGWSDYAAEAAVKPLGGGGMGLAVAVHSVKDYLLFRWRGPAQRGSRTQAPQDVLQLVRAADGKESVLAEKQTGYRPYEFCRMGVDWRGEAVVCTVDGNEVFRAAVPGLKCGQVALWALKGDPVFFDDVHVAADRALLEAAHRPERAVNRIMAHEADMAEWANPAIEWARDIQTGWAVHQARFPGDQQVILNAPRFAELEVALGDESAPHGCTILTVKDGRAKVPGAETAVVGAGPFRKIVVRHDGPGIEAEIDGVRIPGRLAADAPAFSRVSVRGLKNLGDPQTVRVASAHVLEYTFNTSPADWKVACGRWGLLNKWICDPRWSWFGGRTKTLAALWNKHVFSGDISVEGHVALMMQQDAEPYERPGDYNITICGDGANLDSGYTLIFGGDNNSWTRLYRKGKLVAESSLEAHRVVSDRIRRPDKPELHQRWFHLKLEKTGGTVSFYRDGVRAFAYKDPEPLDGGRVAFWTLDNGFLLARVRIAHDRLSPAPLEPRAATLFEDARVVNAYDGEATTVVTPVRLSAAIRASLAAPPQGFQPADADAADASDAAGMAKAEDAPDAYRVVNGTGGGAFALQYKAVSVEPQSRSVLRFAYRIEPGAKVDLYLVDISPRASNPDFNPRQTGVCRWRLSGPEECTEYAPVAGTVPGAAADGRWHSVQFDLQPSWRAFWQKRGLDRPPSGIYKLMTGNLENAGYLLAGMNGNHAGAAYTVSDISVLNPREADNQPPRVEKVIWPYDKDGDGHSVQVVFADPGGSGISTDLLKVTLNGKTITRDWPVSEGLDGCSFTNNSLVVRQRFIWDMRQAALPVLAPEANWVLKISSLQDRAGNAAAGTADFSCKADAAAVRQAQKPVAGPVIAFALAGKPEPLWRQQALTMKGVSLPDRHRMRIEESPDAPPWAPAGQQRSIHVVSTGDGSIFGFRIRGSECNLNRSPYLLIDYKIPFETAVNLHLRDASGSLSALVLTDTGDARDGRAEPLAAHAGPPADFIADGAWRRTIVPVQALLMQARGSDFNPYILDMTFYDHGWRGNRRGMEYWIHAVQPVPAGRADELSANWSCSDLAGSSDFASCIDEKPGTDPQGLKEVRPGENFAAALQRAGKRLQDGLNYIHLRVRNGAGLWSEPVHRAFLTGTPPPLPPLEPNPANIPASPHRETEMETSFALDFETHTGHVRPIRDCSMEWLNDPAQAALGRRAVKFTAQENDCDAQIMIHQNAWYIDSLPGLRFKYKADPGFQVDLIVEVLGKRLCVRFTGTGAAPENGETIGRIDGVLQDGQWHEARADLRAMINKAWPGLPIRIASKIVLSAQGQDGCKRGATLTLDDVNMVSEGE